MKPAVTLILLLFHFLSCAVNAQEKVQWLTFEQLEDSLETAPKKVFIDFYTDWCSYCKKMDKTVFTNPAVIQALNREYYAVKLDAETQDTIRFEGQLLVNRQATKRRAGIHDLAVLLGSQNGDFVPPVFLLLDENFRVIDRRFEYMSSEKLLKWMENKPIY